MSVKLLTEDERRLAADQLFEQIEEAVRKYKAPDMVTEKIVGRVGLIGQLGGITRTTVFGSLVFAGVYAAIVGISKEQILNLLSELYDNTEMNEATPEAKQHFAEANAAFHAQQTQVTQTVEDMGFEGLDKNIVLAPLPKMKQ